MTAVTITTVNGSSAWEAFPLKVGVFFSPLMCLFSKLRTITTGRIWWDSCLCCVALVHYIPLCGHQNIIPFALQYTLQKNVQEQIPKSSKQKVLPCPFLSDPVVSSPLT